MEIRPDEEIPRATQEYAKKELVLIWNSKRLALTSFLTLILEISCIFSINLFYKCYAPLILIEFLGIFGAMKMNKTVLIIYQVLLILKILIKIPYLETLDKSSFYKTLNYSYFCEYQILQLEIRWSMILVVEVFQIYLIILFIIRTFKLEKTAKLSCLEFMRTSRSLVFF